MIHKIRPTLRHLNSKKKLGFLFLSLGVICMLAGLWSAFHKTSLLSPISSRSSFEFLFNTDQGDNHSKRVVYGFLPYWELNNFTLQPETTHLSYFSLGIAADGSVPTQDADGKVEPGYQKLNTDQTVSFFTQQKQQNGKVDLTFTQFDNDTIAAFLTSPTAHQKFIDSVDSALQAYPIDGINIDIEYTGEVTDTLRADYVNFLTELRQHLNQKTPHPEVSVDTFVSGASKYMIWDVPKIQEQVDYVIVMAYDFHRKSSPQAGPVAPLFGGKDLWDSDITQYLKDYVAQAPAQKILLGVPFYGYEWQTLSTDSQSNTFPDTGSTATLKDVQDLLSPTPPTGVSNVHEYWNETALSPYLSYKKGQDTYLIYYENSRSISYKLDLVNQLNLGGIAIWALGYEGSSRDLWDVIQRKI